MRLCIEICGLLPITSTQLFYLYLYIVCVGLHMFSSQVLLFLLAARILQYPGESLFRADMFLCSLILRLYSTSICLVQLMKVNCCTYMCVHVIMLSTSSSGLDHQTVLVDLIIHKGWQIMLPIGSWHQYNGVVESS